MYEMTRQAELEARCDELTDSIEMIQDALEDDDVAAALEIASDVLGTDEDDE